MHLSRTFLALVAAALFTGCAGLTDTSAATVNGEPIPEEAVQNELEEFRATERYDQLAEQGDIGQVERDFVQGVLAQLVRRAVLEPLAAERGLEVTEADVDAQMEQIKADFPDQTAFEEALKEQALTEATLRDLVKDRLLEDAIRQEVTVDAQATPEEVREYYTENIEQFQTTCVSHILTPDEGGARVIAAELERVPAKDLKEEFARLAAKHSQDTSNAKQGGDLGCVRAGQFVPEFETVMNSLDIGEVSQPVRTQFGFHIIWVTDRKTESFEAVQDQLLEQLTGPRQDEAWAAFLEQAYVDADVEINSRYGVLDLATGQILDPSASQVPGGQAPKATEPEEELNPADPGSEPAQP